ncbi:MAG: hypothetical protein R2856_08415 [Caldilineaceae bacterium]
MSEAAPREPQKKIDLIARLVSDRASSGEKAVPIWPINWAEPGDLIYNYLREAREENRREVSIPPFGNSHRFTPVPAQWIQQALRWGDAWLSRRATWARIPGDGSRCW